MALQGQLERFNKQQEKCQSTLASIAARASASKPSGPLRSEYHAASLRPPTPVRFSNDTERLQYINSIRKAPVGAQIKRVIDLLLETRQALTAQQINEACYVDMYANKAVFDSIKNNPKVNYDGKRFSYKAKHNIKDKSQLLTLIKQHPGGIGVSDLKDAYSTVMEDLQALKASGRIWLLSNFDSQEDVAYLNDLRGIIDVDDEIKLFFRDIELPSDMLDIEKELQRNGMRPATNTTQRRLAAQVCGITYKSKMVKKKKKKKVSKRMKLTNVHLPELFRNLSAGVL